MSIRETLDKIKKSIQDKIDETKLDFAMRRSASGGTQFSKNDERQLMQLIDLYLSGKMKPDEMMNFINLTKKYFYHTKGIDSAVELPKTTIENITTTDATTGETVIATSTIASYNRARNVFIINGLTFQKCLDSIKSTDKSYLVDIINFTGHELTHFDQHVASENFDKLSPEEQRNFDKKTYKVIKDIENSYESQLNAKELLDMDSFMGNYTKSMQSFGFNANNFELFQRVRYLKYTYERDARSSAIDFSKSFMSLIENSSFASPQAKLWAKESYKFIEKIEQDEIKTEELIINREENKLFDNYYSVIGRQALANIVNDNEHKTFNHSQSLIYKRCLAEIVEHFTYQEKEDFLKIAIARNLPQFANVIIKSIKKDPNYLENSTQLQDMLTTSIAKDCFEIGENKTPTKINYGSICGENIDLSLLLTEDRLAYCVISCLGKNNYAGASKLSALIKTNHFSKEIILEKARLIEKSNFSGKEFAIKSLIVNIPFEDAVNLLETASKENLPNLKKELFTALNLMPEYHLNRINVLKKLELTEEETKYKTEEEIIMAGCAAYYENYYFESLLNANNTPQNNAAIQKVCEYFKSIYKAELRAGGKSLAEQMSKDTSIQDFLTGFEFDFEVAKQIVNNRAACLNLLKAISEGTIVINGTKTTIDNNDKIRLTQLLTSTLAQREWDRQLAEIEKTTMQEHVKE